MLVKFSIILFFLFPKIILFALKFLKEIFLDFLCILQYFRFLLFLSLWKKYEIYFKCFFIRKFMQVYIKYTFYWIISLREKKTATRQTETSSFVMKKIGSTCRWIWAWINIYHTTKQLWYFMELGNKNMKGIPERIIPVIKSRKHTLNIFSIYLNTL